MNVKNFQQILKVEPTQYNGKLADGRMFIVLFRWEQFRVWISKRATNDIKSATFPNGDLILTKIIKPTHKELTRGELNKTFIMREMEKKGFKFSNKK